MKGNMVGMNDVNEKPAFEVLPKDTYRVRIVEMGEKVTKNGDPMVALTLEVVDGQYAGRKAWDNIILSANPESPGWKARWRAKMFLKAIGQPHNGDNFAWDSDDWQFAECMAKLGHEKQAEGKYAGELRNVVIDYKAVEQSAPASAESQVPF